MTVPAAIERSMTSGLRVYAMSSPTAALTATPLPHRRMVLLTDRKRASFVRECATVPIRAAVRSHFKTAAFDRSATPPKQQ
jgi:hypothetical protein